MNVNSYNNFRKHQWRVSLRSASKNFSKYPRCEPTLSKPTPLSSKTWRKTKSWRTVLCCRFLKGIRDPSDFRVVKLSAKIRPQSKNSSHKRRSKRESHRKIFLHKNNLLLSRSLSQTSLNWSRTWKGYKTPGKKIPY